MLLPQETTKLQAWLRRVPFYWAVAFVVSLLIAAAPGMIYLVAEDGALDHLRGKSEAVVAEVESVEASRSCSRSNRTRYEIGLSWTIDGTPGTGTTQRCYDAPPQVGDTMDVWVGPGGAVSLNSPTGERVGLLVISLVLGLPSVAYGVAVVVSQRNRRRRLLAVGDLGLSVATPVHVHRGYRGRTLLSPAARSPGRNVRAHGFLTIIYTQYGAASIARLPRRGAGDWSLRLAQVAGNPRKRVGLLERGQERCWIYLTMPR